MLRADAVTIKVGKKVLLNNVSITVNPSELVAVIGPNGAGKSTLLKTLSGEIEPTVGKVTMNGKKMADWVLSKRAQLCAVLPQSSTLSFPFSVLDVVLMGRSPHDKNRTLAKDQEIAEHALEIVGIKTLAERIYTTLSGGERQRVHFARALTQIWLPIDSQTRYLMLDEPTSALDISCQHDCLKISRDFAKQQGVGVLMVLHDLNLASLYADRIVVLQGGELVEYGTPKKVINKHLIQDVFEYSAMVYAHPLNNNLPLVVSMNHSGDDSDQKKPYSLEELI